jgi:L-threonylcarbamoyladenylate synthase
MDGSVRRSVIAARAAYASAAALVALASIVRLQLRSAAAVCAGYRAAMPEVVVIDSNSRDAIARAAQRLREGQLVACPTETVYGLGANALDGDAVARIFAAKGRPSHNPVIVHVASIDDAQRVVRKWPTVAQRLADRFWPGPLTLVLPKSPDVPSSVTAGLDKVGVRVPSHPIALALLRAANVPVAAPSANLSNAVSPTTAQHVATSLAHNDVLVLDGGACEVGIESTVVDVSGDVPVLLRPGGISKAALERELGCAIELATTTARDDAPRASPGMLHKHYAPRAKVELIAHGDAMAAQRAIADASERGETIGALAITEAVRNAAIACIRIAAMADNPRDYARWLYAELHAMDDAHVARIVIEAAPSDGAWDGVRDRVQRASH